MNEVKVIKANKKSEDNSKKRDTLLKVAPYIRVSTNDEEQKNSYESQINHYKTLINSNTDWILADIYADEGISGTQVKKRNDFQRMIHDALNDKIDYIITKSISRFARNTEDTLKYVRLLKDRDIAIFFEKENINTTTMNGELLLTILSSVAQQESESIATNVKMGIKMKMKRGEMVGMPQCLGYNYDKDTKELTINEKEAEIVKHIFKRYVEGAGGYVIARELTECKDWYTKRGNKRWDATSILKIIQNEKYIGDLLLGKTITTDTITHRKIKNLGEEEMYYVTNHHEKIIDKLLFEKANEILKKRRKETKSNMPRKGKYSRKYAFSSITKCGFCGARTSRRRWHKDKPYEKFVWQCTNYLSNGKNACSNSKGVDENLLEEAFIQTFNTLQENDTESIKEFIERFVKMSNNNNYTKELKEIESKISKTKDRMSKLVDMRLDETIDESVYKAKYDKLSTELEDLEMAADELEKANAGMSTIKQRVKDLLSVISGKNKKIMKEFDRDIFDKIIDEVIIGNIDEHDNIDPYIIIFKLKSGLEFVNEVIFNEKNTGGKKPYAKRRLDTSCINNKDTTITLEFTYDFGDSIYKQHNELRNGKKEVNVIVLF